ncbi:Metal-pseudopaline receptor CntO [Sporomusa rhizae]|uniref:TonB-dependent receptor family protein n=1 Tax=Sporomusa rhizae TaxID=357999 RepID=UPI00352AF4CA
MKKNCYRKVLSLSIGLSLTLPIYCLANETPSFDLEQVVVTATRTEAKMKDVPASVSIVTAKEIKESGANNMAEVLKKVSGLFVVDLYGSGCDTRMGLRGFQGVDGNQDIQVQVDGITVNNRGQNAYTALGNINIDSIEKVEIVRGPASALYGADSMGGVINVITKKGSPDGKTTVALKNGSFKGRDYAFSHSGQEKNLSYSFSYRIQKGDGYRKNNDYDNKFFNSRFDIDFDKKSNVEVIIDHNDRYYRYPGLLTQAQYDQDPLRTSTPNDFRKLKEDRIAAIYKSQISPDMSLTNKIFYSKTNESRHFDMEIPSKNADVYRLKDGDGTAYGVESQVNFKTQLWGREHDIITGILYKREKLAKDFFYESFDVPYEFGDTILKQKTTAFYVQDKLNVSPKASLLFGIRQDKFNFDFSDHKDSSQNYSSSTDAWSPKMALNYMLSDKTNAYVSISRAFKPPSDLRRIQTNKLEPEKGWNYEVGIKSSPSEKISYSLAAYRMNIDNLIVLNPVDLKSQQNAGKAHHQGIEFESEYQLASKWSGFLNYNYTQAKYDNYLYKDDYGSKHVADGKNVEQVPKQIIVTGLRYDDKQNFQGNLSLRWVDKQYMDPMNEAPLPSYAVVDLGLRQKLDKDTTLSLNVNNLFDRKYAEYAHYNSKLHEYGYSPGVGRNIWVGLSKQL